MSDNTRCPDCDRPLATDSDFDTIPDGEGEHLCWRVFLNDRCFAEPVDWRARAERAEAENERLRERLKLGPPGTIGHSLGDLANTLMSATDILGLQNERDEARAERNRLAAELAEAEQPRPADVELCKECERAHGEQIDRLAAVLDEVREQCGRVSTEADFARILNRAALADSEERGTDGEHCQDCGAGYASVYTVPDSLWGQVSGRTDGGGLLCMSCFERRAAALGVSVFWVGSGDPIALADSPEPGKCATCGAEAGHPGGRLCHAAPGPECVRAIANGDECADCPMLAADGEGGGG